MRIILIRKLEVSYQIKRMVLNQSSAVSMCEFNPIVMRILCEKRSEKIQAMTCQQIL